jgi:FAD/FMN-containing dehydrogenase
VSKKGDPEFAAFNGGLGVFGVMTELLLQLTPPTVTQLITVVKNDTAMMEDINKLLKVGVRL